MGEGVNLESCIKGLGGAMLDVTFGSKCYLMF